MPSDRKGTLGLCFAVASLPRAIVARWLAGGKGVPGGFLSLGLEKSHRTFASAQISCHGSCVCAGQVFNAHTAKKYTYLQRTSPKWLYWPWLGAASADSSAAAAPEGSTYRRDECVVELHVAEIQNGSRLFLKAFTFSPPRAGNKSVSVGTLYSLS